MPVRAACIAHNTPFQKGEAPTSGQQKRLGSFVLYLKSIILIHTKFVFKWYLKIMRHKHHSKHAYKSIGKHLSRAYTRVQTRSVPPSVADITPAISQPGTRGRKDWLRDNTHTWPSRASISLDLQGSAQRDAPLSLSRQQVCAPRPPSPSSAAAAERIRLWWWALACR